MDVRREPIFRFSAGSSDLETTEEEHVLNTAGNEITEPIRPIIKRQIVLSKAESDKVGICRS